MLSGPELTRMVLNFGRTRTRVRPKFEAALEICQQVKAHAPHCRVILTMYEVKLLGRDSAELTAPSIALEMLGGR